MWISPTYSYQFEGPRDGVAHLEVHAGSDSPIGAGGLITARLVLDEGTTSETTRPVRVIAAQARPPGPGTQLALVPAYQLKRVWQQLPEGNADDITWDQVGNYHADKVGHWEPNGEELWLYINMDEQQFQSERLQWGRRFGEGTADRLVDRYVAYVAFHLFQLYDFSQRSASATAEHTGNGNSDTERENAVSYDPESPFVTQELRRVAATLIQTLRSEADLARLQNAGDQTGY